jgi:hypothetical protein
MIASEDHLFGWISDAETVASALQEQTSSLAK